MHKIGEKIAIPERTGYVSTNGRVNTTVPGRWIGKSVEVVILDEDNIVIAKRRYIIKSKTFNQSFSAFKGSRYIIFIK